MEKKFTMPKELSDAVENKTPTEELSLNFKSTSAYKKWLAFKHMNLGAAKTHQKVTIAGKEHKVQH